MPLLPVRVPGGAFFVLKVNLEGIKENNAGFVRFSAIYAEKAGNSFRYNEEERMEAARMEGGIPCVYGSCIRNDHSLWVTVIPNPIHEYGGV